MGKGKLYLRVVLLILTIFSLVSCKMLFSLFENVKSTAAVVHIVLRPPYDLLTAAVHAYYGRRIVIII